MKKSKFLFILLTFLPVLSYVSCKQYFVKDNEHVSELKSTFDSFLYKYDDFEDELPVVILDHNNMSSKNIVSIDKSQAFQDIDYLFSLLKYGYSGYGYFGGDEKFSLTKENIINSISRFQENNIPIDVFQDIIYSNLNFIQDSHFIIGRKSLCNYTKYYSSRKFEFQKDISGLYTLIDDETFYLTGVNGENPTNYIKPSLNEKGDIVYNFGILSDSLDVNIPINILLESHQCSENIKVRLFEYKPLFEEKTHAYEYYEINGIPILNVNALCRIAPEDDTMKKFISHSELFRNSSDLIIDLRNNTGGNIINVEKWFKGFTGIDLKQDIIESGLYTNTSVALSQNKFELKENEPESVNAMCLREISTYERKKYFPGWSPIKYEVFTPIPNETNIIVLLDKTTASAAEFFIHYLSKLDNVTLVGTNSNGCMLTGNSNKAHLPNSKIPLYIPHKLYFKSDFINIDGLGFSPDLWVKPDQSLNRVINYIKNNKGT